MKALLNKTSRVEVGWEVVRVGGGSFQSIGRCEEEVETVLREGYVLAEGTLLRLSRWRMQMGMFPKVRACKVRMRLLGIPLVPCNDFGIENLFRRAGRVVEGSMAFVEGGRLLLMQLVAWVCSGRPIPTSLVVDLARTS